MTAPDDAVAGPLSASEISAPETMVVGSVASLLPVSESPAVGTEARRLTEPDTVVWISATSVAVSAVSSAGTLQTTAVGPVAGVGVQPVIVPVAPVNVVPAGTSNVIVVGDERSKPLLLTEMA